MAMQIYDVGLDALGAWGTGTYEWRAFSSHTFNRTAVSILTAVQAGTEITGQANYDPIPVTGMVRTVDDAAHRIEYRCDNPEWVDLGTGVSIAAIMLTKTSGSSNTGIPVGTWALDPVVAIDAANPLVFDLAGGMVAYINQAT